MAKKLFIVGTGTDVGKTYITALLVKKLYENGVSAAYYKAAMSGNIRNADGSLLPGDAHHVKQISGISQPESQMCPYVYEMAVSPHLASKLENDLIDYDVVKNGFETVCREYEYVTMEGSGGILCPIRYDEQKLWLCDIIKDLSLSCLLIADAGLGTINNVILTVEYMRSKGIDINGIIFNNWHGGLMEDDNVLMCEEATGLKVIAKVSEGATDIDIDIEQLKSLYR